MNLLLRRLRRRDLTDHEGEYEHVAAGETLAALAAGAHLEIIPMKSIDGAIAALPPGANVTVTCSPAAGIAETQRRTERLVADGFHVIPHVAARLVTSPSHAAELAAWVRSLGLDEVFVIAGDAPEAAGPYEGALGFLRDFLAADPGVDRIGVPGYPDGHPIISAEVASEQLHAKQTLVDEAGVGAWVSTQMCFDTERIVSWLSAERARGLHLPVRLGVAGVVDRTRLLKVGMRLGVGASMRFLSKNSSAVTKLVAPGGYDPSELLAPLAADAERLDIESLHVFTFNSVADTVDWQNALTA
ncbi:MAG: methylenetetrahydrofolate reductase [Actinomycetota bacterium]